MSKKPGAWAQGLVKTPRPHSLETEETVLGLMLFDSDVAKEIIDRLDPDAFYHEKHRTIFTAAAKAQLDQGEIDILSVTAHIDNLESIGGFSAVAELGEKIATVKHLETHLSRLTHLYRQRQLIDLHLTGLTSMLDRGDDPDEAIEVLRESLAKVYTPNGDKAWWRERKFLQWTSAELSWLVEPFVSPKDVFFLSSDAGVGKTWLLLSMMLDVVTGRPWLGRFTTRKTRCLYCDFDGHGDGDAIRRRLQRLASGMGIGEPYSPLDETFGVMTRFHMPEAVNLFKGTNMARFRTEILKGGFELVFIDTFIAVHGSDNENDSGKMGIVMNRLRQLAYETGAAFAIAHHHRKESQLGGDSMGSRYRGSTTIKAGADSMLECRKERSGIVRISHSKPRHTEQLEDWAVSVQNNDMGVIVQAEADDQLRTGRKEEAVKWILIDLWKLPDAKQGRMDQPDVIRLGKQAGIGSVNVIREALDTLESRGLLKYETPYKGTRARTKVWFLPDKLD